MELLRFTRRRCRPALALLVAVLLLPSAGAAAAAAAAGDLGAPAAPARMLQHSRRHHKHHRRPRHHRHHKHHGHKKHHGHHKHRGHRKHHRRHGRKHRGHKNRRNTKRGIGKKILRQFTKAYGVCKDLTQRVRNQFRNDCEAANQQQAATDCEAARAQITAEELDQVRNPRPPGPHPHPPPYGSERVIVEDVIAPYRRTILVPALPPYSEYECLVTGRTLDFGSPPPPVHDEFKRDVRVLDAELKIDVAVLVADVYNNRESVSRLEGALAGEQKRLEGEIGDLVGQSACDPIFGNPASCATLKDDQRKVAGIKDELKYLAQHKSYSKGVSRRIARRLG